MSDASKMTHAEIMRATLIAKRQEHRDLDDAIHALHDKRHGDLMALQRLKRKKLALKDEIARIEDEVTQILLLNAACHVYMRLFTGGMSWM